MKALSELKTGDKIITSRGDVYVVRQHLNDNFFLGADHHFGSKTLRFWSTELWSLDQLESIGARILDNELAP